MRWVPPALARQVRASKIRSQQHHRRNAVLALALGERWEVNAKSVPEHVQALRAVADSASWWGYPHPARSHREAIRQRASIKELALVQPATPDHEVWVMILAVLVRRFKARLLLRQAAAARM